jgi:pimeloyl-ACP methyl ester carboxylesterase
MRMNDAEQLEHLKLAMGIAGLPADDVSLPVSHYVTINKLRLHYLDWGAHGKPPILFLHGGGISAHTWDLVCAVLRRDYHCVALDQRGHGDSEWSDELDYAVETQKRDVEAFVQHLGFDRFRLIGMSMGGINAMLYAIEHSQRLDALTIIDTGPDIRRAGGQRIIDFVRQTEEADSIEDLIAQTLKFNPSRDSRLLKRSLLHTFRQREDGKWVRKNDMRHWRQPDAARRVERLADYWPLVSRISCPTLVVRGAKSDVFHDEDAEKFARALPNGRWLRIENAGHTVQGDNPRGLLEALRAFFAEVTGPSRG